MTEHTDMIKEKAIKLEAEEWGNKVAYIHASNGIIETAFNNGVRKFEENKPGGKKWTEGTKESPETLMQSFGRWLDDHRGK
jgi:hypothetical protein|tara:strand:- start:972 stop:1214 length:243 start_codon:yes stop_codon:yes gene_type:complete